MESDSEGASESKNSIPAAPVATVGDLRRVLEPYADSTRIEANHIFKLGDFLKGVDYWSSSDDEIEREFSLGFRKADQHDEKQSWVTLELTPTYETITRADSLEGEGREL